MSPKPDFYLTSTETQTSFESRECFIEKRLTIEGRTEDVLIVRIFPHIIGQPYGLGDKDIERLIIATRFTGNTFFPVNEWPLYVNVCRIVNGDIFESGKVSLNDIQLIMHGELYKTTDEAKQAIDRYKKQINQ